MKQLVIDRGRWLRATTAGDSGSFLLRGKDGLRCCLGLYLESCGVPDGAMLQQFYPTSHSLDGLVSDEAAWTRQSLTYEERRELGPCIPDATAIATINDHPEMSEQARERWLEAAFATKGIAVTFVDGAPAPQGGDQ